MPIDQRKARSGSENKVDAAKLLSDLRQCQKDIVSYRHKCDRQIEEIEKNYAKNVKTHFEKRNALMQNFSRLWSIAIMNHPMLSTVFEPGEIDVLNYLTNLEVVEDPENSDIFKIIFTFRKNPYFENRTLTKEFKQTGSTNSVVRWKSGQIFPKLTNHELWEDDELGLQYKGFFRWYFDPEENHCDPIADIIKSCIWYNPMEYYDKKVIDKGDQLSATEPEKDEKKIAAATTLEQSESSKDAETMAKFRKPSVRSLN